MVLCVRRVIEGAQVEAQSELETSLW